MFDGKNSATRHRKYRYYIEELLVVKGIFEDDL